MASEGPERASEAPALTSLPRVEDLPSAADGYDREKVREAFEAFRRHTTQLQVQLRVFQSAGQSGVEPTGHAVRMDSLHLIRAAAEMADTIERDAQSASAAQFRRTEEEVTRRQRELQQREGEVERFRNESERQRAEMLNAAKAEARQTVQEAEQQASQEIKESESRAARLLEQARHQATELTNAARAEVEQTLEWARSQAGAIIHRAQDGAEQMLQAAGLGEEATGRVAESIVDAARAAAEASRGGPGPEQSVGPRPEQSPPLRGPTPVQAEPEENAGPAEAPPEEDEPGPPLSPPVSPGPSPPSPPEAHDEDPRPEGDRSDDG
jgi:F0F1-type ATP synthase membrane subunit b/b'